MDADTILRIKPALTQYLHEFDGCFGRITARQHLDTYVQGQLGDLLRKSIEPIADAAGTPPRNLQEFLSLYRWHESAIRDRLPVYDPMIPRPPAPKPGQPAQAPAEDPAETTAAADQLADAGPKAPTTSKTAKGTEKPKSSKPTVTIEQVLQQAGNCSHTMRAQLQGGSGPAMVQAESCPWACVACASGHPG